MSITVSIPIPGWTHIKITIVGTTYLLCNNWQTANGERRDCRTDPEVFGKLTPEQQFRQALFPVQGREDWPDERPGKYGMPGRFVKSACCQVARNLKNWEMLSSLRYGLSIEDGVAPISVVPELRTGTVNVAAHRSGRKMVEKTRALFGKGWSMMLTSKIDQSKLSVGALVDVINQAGREIGIGEWRIEKRGKYGAFRLGNITV